MKQLITYRRKLDGLGYEARNRIGWIAARNGREAFGTTRKDARAVLESMEVLALARKTSHVGSNREE